jgi:hypothetical protein
MSTTQSARLALPCILFTFEQRIVICDDRRLRAHAKILSVCGDIYDGNHGQRCSARLPIGWAEIMDGVHQGQTPSLYEGTDSLFADAGILSKPGNECVPQIMPEAPIAFIFQPSARWHKVRRLLVPAVQVNIGAQQVIVANASIKDQNIGKTSPMGLPVT